MDYVRVLDLKADYRKLAQTLRADHRQLEKERARLAEIERRGGDTHARRYKVSEFERRIARLEERRRDLQEVAIRSWDNTHP